MQFDDYRRHDALGLAALIRRGEVSGQEVLEAALARLHAVNPVVNAVTYLHAPALDPAHAPPPEGAPFAGVPCFIPSK